MVCSVVVVDEGAGFEGALIRATEDAEMMMRLLGKRSDREEDALVLYDQPRDFFEGMDDPFAAEFAESVGGGARYTRPAKKMRQIRLTDPGYDEFRVLELHGAPNGFGSVASEEVTLTTTKPVVTQGTTVYTEDEFEVSVEGGMGILKFPINDYIGRPVKRQTYMGWIIVYGTLLQQTIGIDYASSHSRSKKVGTWGGVTWEQDGPFNGPGNVGVLTKDEL